jgi:hypothetical protein
MVAALKIVTVLLFLAFLAFSNYRTSAGYIFGHFQYRFLFLLSTGEIFLVIFLLVAVKISCPLLRGLIKVCILKMVLCYRN